MQMLLAPVVLSFLLPGAPPPAWIIRSRTLVATIVEAPDTQPQTWKESPSGLRFIEELVGSGSLLRQNDVVSLHYTVSLAESGTELGTSRGRWPLTFAFEKHDVPIWDEAVAGMRIGGKRRVIVPCKRIPSSQMPNVPRDQDGEPVRLDIEVLRVEKGAIAILPSILPPGNRRLVIFRWLFVISFLPYLLPEDLKPEAFKSGDMQAINEAREAAQNALYLGGDAALSLESLFQ